MSEQTSSDPRGGAPQADLPTIIYEGEHLQFVNRNGWEYATRKRSTGVIMILAVNEADEIILVEQLRPPLGGSVIELPAGLVGDIAGEENEDPAEAAMRELLEETGYAAQSMERIACGPTSPGLSDETVILYRAVDIERVGDGGGDDAENITVHEVALRDAEAWLRQREAGGTFIDLKVYTGLYFAGSNRPDDSGSGD